MSLGFLAASQLDGLRGLVVALAFLLITASSMIHFVLDTRRMRLTLRWNLLFFSYYRPLLLSLYRIVAKSLDKKSRLDLLTYRTDDLIAALDEAGADFEQVTGDRTVNIASFDIEYVQRLREGIRVGSTDYKLIPLSEFWADDTFSLIPARIPSDVRKKILQRLDSEHLYALPIGWGLVGVAILENDLSGTEIAELVTVEAAGRRGFSFDLFFKSCEAIRGRGYQVFCYEFPAAIAQLVSLNCTGHLSIAQEEEPLILEVFRQLNSCIGGECIIADPVVLLRRIREAKKCIVIGGATWFGIKGTLLPVATPDSAPRYGGFCECFGVLARPTQDPSGDWEDDASTLVSWLADHLGEQLTGQSASQTRGSIVANYLPALRKSKSRSSNPSDAEVDPWVNHPMQIDQTTDVMFRQFPPGADDPSRLYRELWRRARDSGEQMVSRGVSTALKMPEVSENLPD